MSRVMTIVLSSLLVYGVWQGDCGIVNAEEGLNIYTVLPPDAIRAILHPEFVSAQEASVGDAAAMIGVVLNDQAHAYSAVLLNTHEIVNDLVGGMKIATTW
jgi:hypothetical protein